MQAPESHIRYVQKAEMDKDCQTVTWLDCDTEMQAGTPPGQNICLSKIENCPTKIKFGLPNGLALYLILYTGHETKYGE